MTSVRRKGLLGMLTVGLAGGVASGWMSPTDPPPLGGSPLEVVKEDPLVVGVKAEVPIGPKPTDVTTRQDAAVALEWAGPAAVKVNSNSDYTLTVSNTCNQPVQKVVVQVRMPKDTTATATTPEAKIIDGIYLWDLGTLEPKAVRPLKLSLNQATRGEFGCQAWVTFTGTTGMTVKVLEPKLSAQVIVPDRVAVGDPISVTYLVRNVGDTVVTGVTAKAAGSVDPKAAITPFVGAISLDMGKESRTVVQERATAGGDITYTLTATGSDGTTATAKGTVHVLVPKLNVAIEGPAERIVGKRTTYKVTVRNTGELPLSNVQFQVPIPQGLRLLDKSGTATGQPVFTFGDATQNPHGLEVGPKSVSAEFDVLPVVPGQYTLTATASASRDTKATADARTVVEGIPAMRMEVVDLADPVEKGGETTYEIRLTNTGSKSDGNVKLSCVLPKELDFVSATGPVGHLPVVGDGRQVVFEQINELAPKTEAVFKVRVKAVGTGDVRFKASITSKHLSVPVTKEESTRVFGD